MNRKFLLALLFAFAFSLVQVHTASAQSSKELEELMNEPDAGSKEAKKKSKKKQATNEEAVPSQQEQPKEAKQEKPKEEKPKSAEAKKEQPKQEDPKKEEAKPAEVKKEEKKKEEPKKEEAKPAEVKKGQPKEEKKQEQKPAETKKEPAKQEPKKEEAKPAEVKKEQPKEEKKAEQKKEEPKATEVKKEKPQAEPKKEEAKPAEAQKTETPPATKSEATKPTSPESTGLSYGKNKSLGKKSFKRGNIDNGVRYYAAAVVQKPGNRKIMQALADGYLAGRNYEVAAHWYSLLVIMDSVKFKAPLNHFQYALCLKYMGRYEEAKTAFSTFNKRAGDDEDLIPWKSRSKKEIEGCDLGISLMNSANKKQELKVTRMGDGINQPLNDFSPVMQSKSAMLFAARNSDEMSVVKKKEQYTTPSRMYFATLQGKNWSARQEMPAEINAAGMHVGNPAFSPNMKTLVYTQCQQDVKTGKMRCDLYQSKYENNKWQPGTKLEATVNLETATNTYPCFGKNESGNTVLFFASDRNPGKGMDLFVSEMNEKGKFMKARTIATPVNTKGDEVTPYFDYKTKTLYFSSNGHINIGGLDVFKSSYVNGDFTDPVNLGLPVNTSADDYYYSFNPDLPNGFVVSNRSGGNSAKCATCSDDIFTLSKKQLQLLTRGMLVEQTDTSRGYAKEGLVTLFDADEGVELKNYQVAGGKYEFAVEADKNYKMVSRKEDFNDGVVLFSTKGMYNDSTLDYDVYLVSKKAYSLVGMKIGTVYWAYNDFRLIESAPDTLNRVLDFVKGHPEVIIEVGSHTDSKGSDEYNEKLSKKRSDAVMKYLVYSNVPQERVISKAYGESQPAEPNTNPDGSDNLEGRAKNRRTEFKVIEEIKR